MLEGELATIRCAGANSTDDLVGAVFSLLSDPDLPEHAQVLLDVRDSDSILRRSIPDLRRITATFARVSARFDRRCRRR